MVMVHLLRGYNSKHPQTWDESLPSLQFAFNRAIHSSTQKEPLEVWAIYRGVPLTCLVMSRKEEGEVISVYTVKSLFDGMNISGRIVTIEYDPNQNAYICLIHYGD
ncbi:50S ribosomal protein L2, plastid-like, partial [Dendrobium catenatum]|uniref:50S ribosomal protein L2, plastid-like n=1 Tax=Dendrobium catenatum TaxID=906689 RepID=UPI00109F78BA